MSSASESTSRSVIRQANYALIVAAIILTLNGLFKTDSVEILVAYLMIMGATLLPTAMWIGARAPGLPVLPVVIAPYFVYFALPILRGGEAVLEYSSAEILRAGATVSLFIVVATLVSRFVAGQPHQGHWASLDVAAAPRLPNLIFVGLSLGIAYQVALIAGWFPDLGSFFGLVRSIVYTFTSVACYFLGVARARGLLTGSRWTVALAELIILILLSWSSLFLVGGIMYALTAAMGFVIVSKRVPWAVALVGLLAVTLLHAGKAEMRKNYWEEGNNFVSGYSIAMFPNLMVEWVRAGIVGLTSDAEVTDALGRASLVHMLLRAQRLTPDSVAYLDGETYALLPQMLVPRFLDPDKLTSQAGMNLLNIHYGLQSERDTTTTAVGWGLVPEAFANFGYSGVIVLGFLIGGLCGTLTRWSAKASAVSLPSLFALAAMVNMINMEADLSNLVTSMAQSAGAMLALFFLIRQLVGQEKKRGSVRTYVADNPDHRR